MRILLGDERDLARSLLEGQIAMAETGRWRVRRVLAAGTLVVALAGHLGCGKQDGDGGAGEGPAEGTTGSVFAGLEAGPKKSALEQAKAVARAHYARALALDKKEKFEKSVKDYTGAIEALAAHVEGAAPELKADLALAHYRRGIAHGENGDHASAADDYTKALELGPGNAQAHYRRGVSFARTGEHERAIGELDKALELDAGLTQVYLERGAAHGAKGDHDKAIADLTKAAEQKSDEARIYRSRGAAYAAKGQHDEAIADFTKAIGLKADDPEALYDRGVAFAAKGGHDKAIVDFTKAIELKKDDPGFHTSRAEAHVAKGDYEEAIADYTTAIKLEPDNVETRISRAEACARKGDYGKAVTFYTKTLELWPNSSTALNNLAWLLSSCPDAAQRDGKRAVALAQRAARLAMRNGPAHLDTLAAAYAEAGRFGDAVKAQEGAISLFKERISDYERRLQLYEQSSAACREAEQAVGPAEEADKLSEGKDPARLDALAAAYAKVWRFDDAVKKQKKAVALLKAKKDKKDQKEIDDHAKRLSVYKARKSRKNAGELAAELADETIKRSRTRHFVSLDALAAACAEAGQFDDAVKAQKEAVSLSKDAKEVEAYKKRLGLYGQRKPYRAK
jgi:tetratricopeptide (TPR) repeat protein